MLCCSSSVCRKEHLALLVAPKGWSTSSTTQGEDAAELCKATRGRVEDMGDPGLMNLKNV
nr:unnamed protein product [Callosobruchus chinensis]